MKNSSALPISSAFQRYLNLTQFQRQTGLFMMQYYSPCSGTQILVRTMRSQLVFGCGIETRRHSKTKCWWCYINLVESGIFIDVVCSVLPSIARCSITHQFREQVTIKPDAARGLQSVHWATACIRLCARYARTFSVNRVTYAQLSDVAFSYGISCVTDQSRVASSWYSAPASSTTIAVGVKLERNVRDKCHLLVDLTTSV